MCFEKPMSCLPLHEPDKATRKVTSGCDVQMWLDTSDCLSQW